MPRFTAFGELARATHHTVLRTFGRLIAISLAIGVPMSGLQVLAHDDPLHWGVEDTILFFVQYPVLSLSLGAMIRLIVGDARGERVGFRTAISWGVRVMFPLAGFLLLTSVMMVVGLLALVIGAVMVTIWFALLPQVVAAEGSDRPRHFGRALRLSAGYRRWIAGAIYIPCSIIILLQILSHFFITPMLGPVDRSGFAAQLTVLWVIGLPGLWAVAGLTLLYLSILGDRRAAAASSDAWLTVPSSA